MRYFTVLSGKKLLAGVLAVFGAGIVLCMVLSRQGLVSAAAAKRDLPIYSVQREEKICALTFDAAWGNEDTQTLIDILKKYNVRATFFVVGGWAEKYPESVKQLADAGHEVMNHSSTHPHMTQMSPDEMKKEVQTCNEKVQAITGTCPTLLRPPYGDYNDLLVSTMRSIGMYTIQWDVDSLDWKDPPPQEIVDRVLKRTREGSIILFHNAAVNTPAALPDIIEGLMERGFAFAPVSELIYTENYTIDHTGRQIPNQS